ncbi:Phage repressor protein [Sphingomonas sp. LH128]|uniref:S24 family peptidase n=1 Tax=Sphingomonas sp. LH128 TaxID=473781 RepID=UPI00027CC487|nr:S24 family peptidase [Sphingomonas sp. LH128]EJU14955.1 Phage repressor protein [Sphingomonas sp. LH128]
MPADTPTRDLLEAVKEAGIPQRVIASKMNLPPSAVSNLFKGERSLKFNEAVILQELLGVANNARGRELPLIGMAGAGNWLEAIEVTRRQVWMPSEAEGQFALDVVGDSMNLVLPEGSTAIIDTEQTELYVGKLYVLLNPDGEATIKRYRSDPARFEPVSDNPEHSPFSVGSGDFRVIGRVTAGLQMF